jgi:hypothetical protein
VLQFLERSIAVTAFSYLGGWLQRIVDAYHKSRLSGVWTHSVHHVDLIQLQLASLYALAAKLHV